MFGYLLAWPFWYDSSVLLGTHTSERWTIVLLISLLFDVRVLTVFFNMVLLHIALLHMASFFGVTTEVGGWKSSGGRA